jgi:hypothetical protein
MPGSPTAVAFQQETVCALKPLLKVVNPGQQLAAICASKVAKMMQLSTNYRAPSRLPRHNTLTYSVSVVPAQHI